MTLFDFRLFMMCCLANFRYFCSEVLISSKRMTQDTTIDIQALTIKSLI